MEGEPLEEGTVVTILAPDSDAVVQLSETDEAELLLAIEEVERGETIAGSELLRNLRHPGA